MTIIPFPSKESSCGCKGPEWITLPVAPQAVARSAFAGEDKLPAAIPLYGALNWLEDLLGRGKKIAGVELAGPGDPLASLPLTLEIISQLKEKYPDFTLSVTTLGLGLEEQADNLALQGVKRITLQVDAVKAETVKKLYRWIRPGKRNMPLVEASKILVSTQAAALAACKKAGIEVSVLTSVYPGINDQEIEAIAQTFASLGAKSMALQAGKGVDSDGEPLPAVPPGLLAVLAEKAGAHLKIVEPPQAAEWCAPQEGEKATLPKPTEARPNVAALSSSGMDVDLHLGQAIQALIYGPREDGLACLLEARDLPEPGSGDDRWLQLAETLSDCFALLAASAGQRPRQILAEQGLPLLLTEDNVEGSVDVLYGGGKKGKKGRK